jgi:hypothetical protein
LNFKDINGRIVAKDRYSCITTRCSHFSFSTWLGVSRLIVFRLGICRFTIGGRSCSSNNSRYGRNSNSFDVVDLGDGVRREQDIYIYIGYVIKTVSK